MCCMDQAVRNMRGLKNLERALEVCGSQEGTRTLTPVKESDFESDASANSATRPGEGRRLLGAVWLSIRAHIAAPLWEQLHAGWR